MEEYPLVSTIILTYKNFKYIYEAIDSVLKQDYKNIELIINDDGSDNFNKDKLFEYIYINKNDNIKNVIINQNDQNIGTVRNYNTAIKLSSGEYFIGVASDDVFYDNSTITKIIEYFKKTNALIITTKRYLYDEKMKKLLQVLPKKKEIKMIKSLNCNDLFKELSKKNFISGASTPFSKKMIQKYGYFDEEYTLLEDYPTYLKLLKNNCKIHFFEIPIIRYRTEGISNNNIINPTLKQDLYKVIKKEILPNRNIIGNFVYRIKKFEYNREIQLRQYDFYEKSLFYFKNLDIIAYKVIQKFNNYLNTKNF
ncbi:glycosyl transferase [Clostridium gelidum]|uniref:Glycosyl transferase n=1 Tax=Clostridium gelidum TaxID=704125 RepID=A0ABM7TDD2_9CLOT|nr:glycosyltransferase [Clostridium gelidum]BCZ47095.1 glycosyl transferase [Clostridium gelidum]